MKEVERPAPVLVPALNHGFDGITDAVSGLIPAFPKIVESAQDVVVPKRREREEGTMRFVLMLEGDTLAGQVTRERDGQQQTAKLNLKREK